MAAPVASTPAPNGPNKALQGGVVRSCPSGDTLVVRPRGVVTPGAERTIHIAGIAAPRLGSREREDDVSRSREGSIQSQSGHVNSCL
jgi:staphylococcal nuclease domain-containing protein 1